MTTKNPKTVNSGVVVAVRGSVVDVRFDEHLPPIYSVLHAGEEDRIVIEVLAQRDAHHVRGIALTPTQVYRSTLKIGDALLLCTDGLTRHVSNDVITEQLKTESPAEQLCQQFIDLANDDGGRDNITIVIARFREPTDGVSDAAAAQLRECAKPDPLADTAPFPKSRFRPSNVSVGAGESSRDLHCLIPSLSCSS